mmetsp:Transcript_51906/g.108450  ORF Transcript_51906/g.108450 Transcript_51906/m.108450 type:complete len:207 (-) Transcript_51906:240-860(-)
MSSMATSSILVIASPAFFSARSRVPCMMRTSSCVRVPCPSASMACCLVSSLSSARRYMVGWSSPSSPSSALAMGQLTGRVSSSRAQTSGHRAAPIGSRHLVNTAWGMISPKTRTKETERMTARYAGAILSRKIGRASMAEALPTSSVTRRRCRFLSSGAMVAACRFSLSVPEAWRIWRFMLSRLMSAMVNPDMIAANAYDKRKEEK